MEDKLITLFCEVDDFAKNTREYSDTKKKRGPSRKLALSELLTIYIFYQMSNFKNFKHYYLDFVLRYRHLFPNRISYHRFIELIPEIIQALTTLLFSKLKNASHANFIDSTKIAVCKNKRIKRNKVFKNLAKVGKSTMGWFFGFKLHLIVNEYGELVAFAITPGNVSDISQVNKLCTLFKFKGRLYGDKGYIGQKLFEELYAKGIKIVTTIKSNMKNKLMDLYDKIMIKKRAVIETINDQLKNICDIEHSRHRSPINFFANIIAGLLSYTFKPSKPAVRGISYNLALN
jgi:hypothetical protein